MDESKAVCLGLRLALQRHSIAEDHSAQAALLGRHATLLDDVGQAHGLYYLTLRSTNDVSAEQMPRYLGRTSELLSTPYNSDEDGGMLLYDNLSEMLFCDYLSRDVVADLARWKCDKKLRHAVAGRMPHHRAIIAATKQPAHAHSYDVSAVPAYHSQTALKAKVPPRVFDVSAPQHVQCCTIHNSVLHIEANSEGNSAPTPGSGSSLRNGGLA